MASNLIGMASNLLIPGTNLILSLVSRRGAAPNAVDQPAKARGKDQHGQRTWVIWGHEPLVTALRTALRELPTLRERIRTRRNKQR